MKKIIITSLIALLVLNSCSSDDDISNPSSNDLIIGVWGNYKDTYIDDNGDEIINVEYDPYYEVATFKTDGTVVSESDIYGTITGTWENLGNNHYDITALGFSKEFDIEFICDKNIMRWKDSDDKYYYYEKISYDHTLCTEDD